MTVPHHHAGIFLSCQWPNYTDRAASQYANLAALKGISPTPTANHQRKRAGKVSL